MSWFSSKKPDAEAAKQMGELGAAVYLNKALGGTGSRKALQKIVNSNAELKKTINTTPGWERAVKAAKNILNAEKTQFEEAQEKRNIPVGNVNKPTNGLTNAQKKKMANGPPVIYEKDPSAPKAVANNGSATRETEQLGSVSGGGRYKTRRSRKKTKKTRKTRGRRH